MQIINKTKNIFILLYILYSLIHHVLCDNECNCESIEEETNCKNCPKCIYYPSGTTTKCITCENLQTKPYYQITTVEDGEGVTISCTTRSSKDGDGLVLKYGTKQIITEGECTSPLVKIEDICYTSDDFETIGASTDGKCLQFKYITTLDGFKYVNCVNQCPSKYKYYNDGDEKECIESCESTKWIKRELNQDNISYIFRCSGNCKEDPREFKYKYKEDSTSPVILYCLDKCPNEAKFYYETTQDIEGLGDIENYECLNNCKPNHFSQGEKCLNVCGNLKTVNLNKKIYTCLGEGEPCPSDFPYLFGDYCLKSCQDSQNQDYFGANQKTTYLDDTTKECLETKGDWKIDTNAKKWVEDCKSASSGPYTQENECVSSCQNNYKYDSLECIDSCNSESYTKFIQGSNACYDQCPSNLGKGFTNSENVNKCQSCNIPNGTPENEEGYYLSGESADNKCYPSCTIGETTYYHNDGDNICFDTQCKNGKIYKYEAYNTKTCHKSCEDIKNLGYKYEKDYTCYKEEDKPILGENQFFYESSSGIIKYTENHKDCLDEGYQYLDSSKKCVKTCQSNVYRKLPTSNELGQCFDSSSTDIPEGCTYYNKTNKICSDNCEFFEIIVGEGISENEENCVTQCPDNFFEKDKTCVTECGSGDIIIDEPNQKKCVQSCDKFLHEKSSKKYCVDKCKNTNEQNEIVFLNYIINNDGKKICKDSCEGLSDQYSLSTENDHQICISNCPTTHPYHNGQFCVEQCDFYLNNDCIDKCNSENSYIHTGNICSDKECPSNAPFYYSQTINSVNVKKCVQNCKDYESHYEYYKIHRTCSGEPEECKEEKECVESCGSGDGNEIYNYEGRCYDECPGGLYIKDETKCVSKCDPNFFEESVETGSESKKLVCLTQRPTEDKIYLRSSGECVSVCPDGEIFVGTDNKCLSSCKEDNKEYYEKITGTNNYQCVINCNGKYHLEGEKECIPSCSSVDEDLYEYNGVCYKSCITINKYSIVDTNDNNKKKCSDQCPGDAQYFQKDKICRDKCNDLTVNKIINDSDTSQYKFCVSECDLNSKYKYLNIITATTTDDPPVSTSTYYCKTSCVYSDNQKRYLKSNYNCYEKCPEPNNYIVEDTNNPNVALECLSKCPPDKPYARKINDEYICSNQECGQNGADVTNKQQFYYLSNYTCIEKCDSNDYNIKNTQICTPSCDSYNSQKLYYYEPNEGEKYCVYDCSSNTDSLTFTALNNKCSAGCETDDFYDVNDKICRIKCPAGKKVDGQLCRDSCAPGTDNKYEDENGYCVSNCSLSQSNYKYNRDNKCVNNCANLYIEYNDCKSTCSENNPFMYEKNCVPTCPSVKRYFSTNNKTCLTDCPKDFPFYTISSEENPKYECSDTCKAYIPSQNSNMNAKKCLGNDCGNDFPVFIYDFKADDNNYRKKCLLQCPSTHPFIYEKECLAECPGDTVHLEDEFECMKMEDCEYGFIKYNTMECVEKCSKHDKIFETTISGKTITLCVDNCTVAEGYLGENNPTNGLKLTYDDQCVTDCPGFSEPEGKFCICKRLFFFDKSTGYKTCLNPDYALCETIANYPIIKIKQNECTDYCDGILSLSGFECYDNSSNCEKNETLKTLTNGDKKCECINKYYYITKENRKIKRCLEENEECPLSHQYLIKETKECVSTCPETKYTKKYGKTCVSECPSSTEEDNGECKCAEKWYISDNLNTICIKNEDECPSDKEIYVETTKQCVSSCIGTGSEVYYSKTCIENCDGKDHTTITDSQIDPKMKLISTQYCKCNYLWYYDIDGNEVCKTREDNITCKNIDGYNFKYVIDLTKQCTNECPEQYPFLFGDKCISDCDDNQIKDDELKTCKCINSWKYNELNQIECLDSCDTDNLQIFSTRQCVTGPNCPPESPLFYQKVCYKPNECPKDTKYDEINQKCACKNKWYKDDLDLENCLTQNADCPGDYKYIDFETNECKKEKGSLYEVNNTLYHNCPINTIKDDTLMQCICDPLAGYWYEETKEGKKISVCGLERCEGDYQYNVYLQKQCFRQCDADLFSYQGICYDKCPNLTEIIPNTNECQLKAVDNEITINDLEKVMTDNIVDLYKKSETIDIGVSQKIVTKEATVEFYGVNKEKKGHTNQDVKSDLSYIDISECIEKIYKSNNMDEKKDDIVILKFDVNRELNNYLITPVEYKFINSRTGKSLDASVCEHNSIRISYPVHNLINRYDKMRAKLRMLEYMKIDLTSNNKDSLREKIDKGKEIIADYPDTDIFDINDKFYSDMCTSVKVNGKDLVIEDRINFFYPKLSLCETNCTYNHTDFINERIYCDCSYKTEFDVKRNYSDSFELNTIDITNNQKSSSNIEVMKCLSNLNKSKSLSKNGGFIYSLIIMILEAILAIVIIFIGINSLSLKLKNKIDKKDDNIEKIEVNVINDNNKKTYEDIKTSERNLDNPPKKKISDFKIEFIPQEYVFLFFSQGEKGIIKKVEKDSVPFKIQYNTRILLEQKKGVNYDNIKPRGPFPNGQNVLVVVDSMNDDINDYIGDDDDNEKNKNKNNLVDTSRNRSNNSSRKGSKKIDEKYNNKNDKNSKINMYKKTIDQFTISDYDPSDENYSVYDVEEEIDEDEDGAAEHHEKGFIETLKKNQRLINRNYEIAMQNKNANFVEILFTEIVDKIYITKILFFTRKFDIFSLQLSVYLLCHLLLLVLNTLFYDINTIKKIWNEENYPGLGYHLGYGLLACLIIWVVYKIFLCLLTNNDKVKDLLKMIHYNNKFNWNKGNEINRKYKNLMWKVKFKFVIYSVIELLLIIFAFLYLTAFGSVYSGTQSNTFKTYGIALIEILIIKILYGTALAIMRHVSLSKQKKVLYDIVLFMNTYLV